MIFHETRLKGAFVIELTPVEDERGSFARAWCEHEFEARGLTSRVVQANLSYNRRRGTLRGVHYQVAPYAEVKIVRCFRGAVYDVIVDLRPQSPTYLEWVGLELSAQNKRMVYVPEGFGHGLQTLEDDTDVFYQMMQFYTPQAERGIRWDDPAVGIQWPDVESRIISAKDRNWPPFSPERLRTLSVQSRTASGAQAR